MRSSNDSSFLSIALCIIAESFILFSLDFRIHTRSHCRDDAVNTPSIIDRLVRVTPQLTLDLLPSEMIGGQALQGCGGFEEALNLRALSS
jgi:hypothetical protein